MKNTARPMSYFSAYPLRFYTGKSKKEVESPYLEAVLSAGKKKAGNSLRIFPMTLPHVPVARLLPLDTAKLPPDIGVTDKTWFNHYE